MYLHNYIEMSNDGQKVILWLFFVLDICIHSDGMSVISIAGMSKGDWSYS